MIKKILITSTLLLFYSSTLVLAQSPTATESGTAIQQAIKDKVKEEVDAIKKAVAKRAYVGTITKIVDLNITLTSVTGDTRNITAATDTTFKLLSGKEGTLKDLKVKDFLIAMGDSDSAGTLTAKRIVVVTKSPADTRVSLYGTVTKASLSQLSITTPDKSSLTLKILSDTKFSTKSKVTAIKDIKIDDTIIAISKPGINKTTFNLSRMFVISTAPTPKPTP